MSNPKKDYYSILNVDKTADESTIKKAYYKLAQKWHPDKNPDSREQAEAKFKEISEAYGILSDENKRQQYDQFGVCDGEAPDFAHGFPDLSEIFGGGFPFGGMGGSFGGMGGPFGGMGGMGGMPGMGGIPGMPGMPGMGGMGGMGGTRGERQKPVQEVRVKLKLSEIFGGTNKNIDISIDEMCQGCEGSGSKTKSRETCQACRGQGIRIQIRQMGPGMISQQQSPCGACNQKGTVIKPQDVCQVCSGKCLISNKLNKTLNISKNFDYESVMLLKNSGNYDPDTKLKADINITFKIAELEKYNLELKNTHDLVLEHPINIHDGLTGYSMYLDSYPDGNKYHFKIHDVIKDGDIKFVKNLGLPNNDNKKNTRGLLYIKFKYIYPNTILSDSESFKSFMKNKEQKHPIDKESYIKEKIYDIKEDSNRSNSNNNSNNNNNNNNNNNMEGVELPGCAQS